MPIGSQGFIPKDVTVAGSASSRITNLVISTPNSEQSHSLTSNLKQVIIKSRGDARIKFSFVSGESGTKYVTIPKGAVIALSDLSFASETLYIQADKASTVEILELY